ncbi:MORN motif [Senna tora]|uniref:MORN motif n=1 Tax=Senna tora TaxID=362788 RepID=A0A834ST95_9FABA|nr:MORN motif [Senna tora]
MHHPKFAVKIGKESLGISSDSTTTTSLQIGTQFQPLTAPTSSFTPNQSDFSIQLQPLSSLPHYPPNPPAPTLTLTQPNCVGNFCHHERFLNTPSASQTPLSSPHKRNTMTQISPSVSSTVTSSSTSSSPYLFFFVSNPRRFFLVDFFSVIAFSAALFISLNLALPRLPSIRLFLARSLPTKLCSSLAGTNSPQPVLWSIGSKPKSEETATSGSWVQVYSNGDVYEGEFHKGKCSGSGVYHYHMSGRYEGEWIDGKYDGFGVETWARGSRYRGQYRQGLRHGIGIYRFYTGDVYAGEWSNGQCHGCGVHTCKDGSRYIGEFKWGVKHGLGHYHFRNGDIYAGEYFADKMHGFGVYQFQNGHLYEGAWHEGRRQGLGMYTFRSGETQSGYWQNGILYEPKMQNSHVDESPYAVDHAKVFKAVQDARCAAEKAYTMAKVDEGVNKVVVAANKAANAARVAAVKAVQNRMPHNNNDI